MNNFHRKRLGSGWREFRKRVFGGLSVRYTRGRVVVVAQAAGSTFFRQETATALELQK